MFLSYRVSFLLPQLRLNRISVRGLEAIMFNPTQIVIQAFVGELKDKYGQIYGVLEPAYPDIIGFVGRLALENIADSDAAYHDMNHTIMVTLDGQEILLGKHTIEGGVTPHDWLHFMISLLCHDIGYVRGVCRGDRDGHAHAHGGGRPRAGSRCAGNAIR